MKWHVGILGALALAASAAFAADKPDPHKDLEKGINAGDKALVIKSLDALAAEGGEKTAKTILTVALDIDKMHHFKVEESNDIFDAAEKALAAVKDAKGEAFIFDSLKKHKDKRVRILLCDVVAKKTSEGAEDALIGALQDKESAVQKDAVAQLGLRKSKKAFEPVIDLLGKAEKKKDDPWLDCLRFLTSLTGKDLATAQEWKGWWDANKATFDPSKVTVKPVEGAGAGQTVARDAPKLFGTEVLSKKVVFILDVSGSMTIKDPIQEPGKPRQSSLSPKDPGYGDLPIERMRMHRLQEAMVKLIEALPSDVRFTIVTFASGCREYSRELNEASAKNKQDAIDFTRGMNPEGFTVTDEALKMAFDIGGEPNTFYLFSDGVPQRGKNADGTPQFIDRKDIMEEVEQMNRVRKVKIYTIGIGEADPNFMRELAQKNGGTFTAVQ